MSLFRAIFAFENGREVANLGFVFTECLHSAFALPSLWVRSAFASGGEEKHKAMRQQKHGTNKRSLTYLLIGFHQDPVDGITLRGRSQDQLAVQPLVLAYSVLRQNIIAIPPGLSQKLLLRGQ